jgi:hypothetical protein
LLLVLLNIQQVLQKRPQMLKESLTVAKIFFFHDPNLTHMIPFQDMLSQIQLWRSLCCGALGESRAAGPE